MNELVCAYLGITFEPETLDGQSIPQKARIIG